MLVPTRVHFFETDAERKEWRRFDPTKKIHDHLRFVDICCGTFHSMATDVNNFVWSWGGRGDVSLGHDDAPLSGTWAERCKSVFPTLSNANKLMVPYELLDWCRKWSVPRIIKSLQFQSEDRVIQLSCGDMHSSILYQSGRMYFCGNGPVVSPIQMKLENADEEDQEKNQTIDEAIDELEQKLVTVSTPRSPSSVWFEKLSVRKIKYISSAGL